MKKAEKENNDGTGGKLYRGQLELTRSNGKKGIEYLQAAVSQHPDFAFGHLVLGRAYYSLGKLNASDKNTAVSMGFLNSALDEFRQVVRLTENNVPALEYCIEILIDKGDSTSLKEAETLLASGLRFAPRNPVFIGASEILLDNVDDAIGKRIDLLKSDPDNRANRMRLSALYVRKMESSIDPAQKQAAINSAIAIMEEDYSKHPDDLKAASSLIGLYVENDNSGAGIRKALGVLKPFLQSQDASLRFNALIVKAEFLRAAKVTDAGLKSIIADGIITHPGLREEAVYLLTQAVKIEPEGSDVADRHLADMYFDMGSMDDAEKAYQIVIDKNKGGENLESVSRRLIEVRIRQAAALLGTPESDETKSKANHASADKKLSDATASIQDMLKRDPRDIQVLMLRASINIQLKAGNQVGAQREPFIKAGINDLNTVLGIDPGNATALFYRALAQMQMGDRLDLALEDLNEATKREGSSRDPDSVRTHQKLAEVYAHAAL